MFSNKDAECSVEMIIVEVRGRQANDYRVIGDVVVLPSCANALIPSGLGQEKKRP